VRRARRPQGRDARRGWATAAAALAVALLAPGCSESRATASSARITVTGSSTLAPLLGEIARRWENRTGVRVDVQTGGSSRGLADVLSGLADVGMSSRALDGRERVRLDARVVALDGVAFVVHADNPVPALDDATLRAIYTGTIDDWALAGGEPGPITVLGRAQGRSEHELFEAYLGLDASSAALDGVAGETLHALKQVASDPAAIAYVSVGAAERQADEGAPLRLLPLRGVEATSRSVASGEHALTRPLLLATRPDAGPRVEAFVAFALSPEHDDLIRAHAFVPPAR